MVQNNYDHHLDGMQKGDMLLSAFVSLGVALTIISTLFMGIKLRWFRYRMNILHDNTTSPVLLRAQSVTEIRENCSVGQYRQSFQEDVLIKDDSSASSPSSSSFNVKSKSDRESIFRWPFKNKLSLSKSQSMNEDSKRAEIVRSTSSPVPLRSSSEKIVNDMAIAEKNERIRRSIYEQLHSKNSMSMPDLVQCDETNRSASPTKMMTIKKGLEVSLEEESDEYQVIDEVQEIKVIQQDFSEAKIEEEEEENVEELLLHVRPPTPIRRRSRSNSIKNNQEQVPVENETTSIQVPPPVKPRKKHMLMNTTVDSENIEADSGSRRSSIDVTPRSILKNSDTSAAHTNSTVHFINVPESSSSEDENDDNDDGNKFNSVWQQIDFHRDQLTRTSNLKSEDNQEDNISDDAPPPLPITPPPRYQPEDRDFSFA